MREACGFHPPLGAAPVQPPWTRPWFEAEVIPALREAVGAALR